MRKNIQSHFPLQEQIYARTAVLKCLWKGLLEFNIKPPKARLLIDGLKGPLGTDAPGSNFFLFHAIFIAFCDIIEECPWGWRDASEKF